MLSEEEVIARLRAVGREVTPCPRHVEEAVRALVRAGATHLEVTWTSEVRMPSPSDPSPQEGPSPLSPQEDLHEGA